MNLTANELRELLKRPGIAAANPHLGAVAHPVRQRNERSEREDPVVEGGTNRVGYCVTIISMRKRLIDGHDNLRTGAKPLIDIITGDLGFASDSDERLTWQYGQLKTDGEEGTVVLIQATA